MKLTKRSIDNLPLPETGQALYWDDELPGYGLRVTKGAKTFIVQRRVAGKSVRVTLGKYGQLTPDQARKLAVKNLAELIQGTNVNAVKEAERVHGVTLAEAYQAFVKFRSLTASTLNRGLAGTHAADRGFRVEVRRSEGVRAGGEAGRCAGERAIREPERRSRRGAITDWK